jgi:hypothetical protein
MRVNKTSRDRSNNFEERLHETMDSELDPEIITPNTGGSEELDYDDKFPLIRQFRSTNMKPNRRGSREGGKQD